MAFRWLRAYFERRDSRESYHYRQPPHYTKRGRNQVEYPEEWTTKRKWTEDSRGYVQWDPHARGHRGQWEGSTEGEIRPRWTTGWFGRGRGEPGEPSEPPPRQDKPYESWPGSRDSQGLVEDERPYRPWPGEEGGDDQRGGR